MLLDPRFKALRFISRDDRDEVVLDLKKDISLVDGSVLLNEKQLLAKRSISSGEEN